MPGVKSVFKSALYTALFVTMLFSSFAIVFGLLAQVLDLTYSEKKKIIEWRYIARSWPPFREVIVSPNFLRNKHIVSVEVWHVAPSC